MKKILSTAVTLLFIFCLSGCNSSKQSKSTSENKNDQTQEESQELIFEESVGEDTDGVDSEEEEPKESAFDALYSENGKDESSKKINKMKANVENQIGW